MPDHLENITAAPVHHEARHYRGRLSQIRIFLVKFLRLFYYQSDWKVLPMSALVAGLVAMVINQSMFITMEGTLLGAFALACVALWNGCFNSIQTICREREVIKREHRAGMHISSYITAHVLYQAMLCLVQTILTVYVCARMGMKFPAEGMFTSSMMLDVGITMFLATFAADMLSLMLSSIVHSTTAAMTLMPFILIFQLVFSGGLFSLPKWAEPLTGLTISGNAMKCIAAQGDYNSLPMVTGWNSLFKMRKEKITITMTVGEIMDLLSESDDETVRELRAGKTQNGLTTGQLIDLIIQDPSMQERRNEEVKYTTTVGALINSIGENEVRDIIQSRTAAASQVAAYEKSESNISGYWQKLLLHALVYTALAAFFLEFIDRDKR